MHVSARVDYGTRAMVELAAAWGHNPHRLTKGDQLAQAQGIPAKFLEGILRQLRQAGLVASQRGAEGGIRARTKVCLWPATARNTSLTGGCLGRVGGGVPVR